MHTAAEQVRLARDRRRLLQLVQAASAIGESSVILLLLFSCSQRWLQENNNVLQLVQAASAIGESSVILLALSLSIPVDTPTIGEGAAVEYLVSFCPTYELPCNTLARITTNCTAMRSLGTNWP